MADVMNDSPYAMSLPRPYDQVQQGLGYSRHYAQRIRDMGKDSKDSWIKKLWTHMFQGKGKDRSKFKDREASLLSQESLSRSRSRLYSHPEFAVRSGRESISSNYSQVPKRKQKDPDRHKDSSSVSASKSKDAVFQRRRKSVNRDRSHDEAKSSSTTPNLPPINAKSPMVSQANETPKLQRSAPASKTNFVQNGVSALYDTDYEYETDTEKPRGRSRSPNAQQRRSKPRSQKQMSFFDRMAKNRTTATETKPPVATTAEVSQSARPERSRTMPAPPAAAASPNAARERTEPKPEVQGREIVKPQSELRSSRGAREPRAPREARPTVYPNRFDRKLRKLHDTYDGNRYARPDHKRSHPFFGSHALIADKMAEEKPKGKRDPQSMELEKKAKAIADKAMKENKVFTCEGPYPVDMYVRISLRKRGWVEKFGPKASGSSSSKANAESKANTETEEDYENIIDQSIPLPWEEENGLYAITSRLVRHFPARFIWGGKNVNTMVLKNEVIVNHFPKARFFFFQGKTGLTHSLRELMWINSNDSHHFFPRCYTLCPDEMEDIIEDFRITACVSILKWVLKMYISKKHRDKFQELLVRRENTKYEEIKFGEESKEVSEPVAVTQKQDEAKEETEQGKEGEGESEEEGEEDEGEEEKEENEDDDDEEESSNNDSENEENGEEEGEEKEEKEALPPPDLDKYKDFIDYENFDEDYNSEYGDEGFETEDEEDESGKSDNEGHKKKKEKHPQLNPKGDPKGPRSSSRQGRVRSSKGRTAVARGQNMHTRGLLYKPPATARVASKTPRTPQNPAPNPTKPGGGLQRSNTFGSMPTNQKQIVPEIKKFKKEKKKAVEIPLKAVEWAVYHLDKYTRSKDHEDIDNKNKGLTPAQWSQLLKWYYQIAHENATVPNMTEGKLKESDEVLKRMKKIWPQYEIDGKRNIWIVKPGDKSKGIGIEFACKLEEIMKYVNNSTLSGTYVMQKYIERPLLIYNCKFDIRQWFLVTDWNPLTVWFYKTSYLRICSQQYNVDSLHEAVHLSNVAVQQNYVNGKRDAKLPENNFMTSDTFVKYLDETEGKGYTWNKITYPGMKTAVVNVLLATQDIQESRKNAFELYGADFILTEDFRPWLLEINSSPGMAPSSVEKCKLCAAVMDDTIKVVIDKRENKNADTGKFELAFRDTQVAPTKCVDTKFMIEGQRIKRMDLAKYNQIDQEESRKADSVEAKKNVPKKDYGTPLEKELRFLEESHSFRFKKQLENDDAVSVDSCDEESAPVSNPKLKPEVAQQRQQQLQTPRNKGTTTPASGRQTPSRLMTSSARAQSPVRRPTTKQRTGSATFNANNTSNIYSNPSGYHGDGRKASYPGSKLSRAQRRSARQSEARLREKQKIYSNMVTSRFFAHV